MYTIHASLDQCHSTLESWKDIRGRFLKLRKDITNDGRIYTPAWVSLFVLSAVFHPAQVSLLGNGFQPKTFLPCNVLIKLICSFTFNKDNNNNEFQHACQSLPYLCAPVGEFILKEIKFLLNFCHFCTKFFPQNIFWSKDFLVKNINQGTNEQTNGSVTSSLLEMLYPQKK